MGSLTYIILFSFCVSILSVLSDEVPAILWNIKGNALNVKQASALVRNDKLFADSLEEIFKDDANILVFSVPRLSLEDFSSSDKPVSSNNTFQNIQTFLETQPYMLLSSVQDPLDSIHQSHCGVEEIVVDQGIDENVLKSISSAFARSCVVILHLTDAGVVGIKDPTSAEIRNVFLPVMDRTSKNVVGIFSSKKSSWGGPTSENRIFRRNLLATADSDKFINITNCLIAYIENATIWANNRTILLSLPPTTSGSSCSNESNSILVLKFQASEEFTDVTLSFNFSVKTGFWSTNTTLQTTGGSTNFDQELVSKDITAPLKYSFSCGDCIIKAKNTSTPRVVLEGFQVQPYAVKKGFSESFDCVTWFTIPIWMGLGIALLYIIIINVGVYALFSVHSMDRFDDPKGKSITVAVSD